MKPFTPLENLRVASSVPETILKRNKFQVERTLQEAFFSQECTLKLSINMNGRDVLDRDAHVQKKVDDRVV